jgi:hypothetical protein
MTGRQEYDRTKDRQRILDEYMIDVFYSSRTASILSKDKFFLNTIHKITVIFQKLFQTYIFCTYKKDVVGANSLDLCNPQKNDSRRKLADIRQNVHAFSHIHALHSCLHVLQTVASGGKNLLTHAALCIMLLYLNVQRGT